MITANRRQTGDVTTTRSLFVSHYQKNRNKNIVKACVLRQSQKRGKYIIVEVKWQKKYINIVL